MRMKEHRMTRRYGLSVPVTVHLPSNREQCSHKGQTRDISTGGVYFTMQEDLSPGAELDFTLRLPTELMRGTEVVVRGHGRVVRVDKRDEQVSDIGVATLIERYDLIREEGARCSGIKK